MRRAITVVTTALLCISFGGTAIAETVRQRDPLGDVKYRDEEGWESVPGWNTKTADISRSTTRHGATRLNYTFGFHRFWKGSWTDAVLSIDTDGDTKPEYRVYWRANRGTKVLKVNDWEDAGTRVPCEQATHRARYADNLMSVTIPRRCIGSPTRVRTYGSVARVQQGDFQTSYFDSIKEGAWSPWASKG